MCDIDLIQRAGDPGRQDKDTVRLQMCHQGHH